MTQRRSIFDFKALDWQITGGLFEAYGLMLTVPLWFTGHFPALGLGLMGAGIVAIILGIRAEDHEREQEVAQ